MQQSADLTTAKGLSAKDIKKQLEKLENKNKKLAEQFKTLAKDRQSLAYKEQFDRFASPKFWSKQYFPGIISKINALLLKSVGEASEVVMSSLGKIFAGAEFLNRHGGVIGKRIFPDTQKIGNGLRALKEELPRLDTNIRELLSVTPMIQITQIKPGEIVSSALKAMIEKKARFFRQHRKKISEIVKKLKTIQGRVQPLQMKMKAFANWFNNFKPLIIEEVKTALFKEKNIRKAAKIARDAVINVVEKQKVAWNDILDELPYITETLTSMVPDIGTVFIDLNETMKRIMGKQPINPEFIQRLLPITNTRIPNIHRAIKNISEGSKNYAAAGA